MNCINVRQARLFACIHNHVHSLWVHNHQDHILAYVLYDFVESDWGDRERDTSLYKKGINSISSNNASQEYFKQFTEILKRNVTVLEQLMVWLFSIAGNSTFITLQLPGIFPPPSITLASFAHFNEQLKGIVLPRAITCLFFLVTKGNAMKK